MGEEKEFEKLAKAADRALFDLHDYMRRNVVRDEAWREVYGYRVKLGFLTDAIVRRGDQ